jgi:hypothetical protein
VNWSLSKLVLAEFERLALEDAIQKVEVECRTLAATQAGEVRSGVAVW